MSWRVGLVLSPLLLLPPAQGPEWRSLFDGKTLAGWHNPYDWGEAWVENGEIRLRGDRKFFLVTTESFRDFVLEAEVALPDTASNSGIQFRSHVEPNSVYGYQAEVDPTARRWSGGLYDESRRGWLHPVQGDSASVRAFRARADGAFDRAGWNRYRIEARGDSLKIFVNGRLTTAYRDTVDREGYVALQHHGEAGKVYRFRNVRVRVLPSRSAPGRTRLIAPQAAPRNVILILSDDHRYDFMGFMERAPEWLETPALDRMAAGGAHVRNAFVTTSLCSPSRASILTGRYAHRHGVVDNTSPIPAGTVFFPGLLQRAGYRTAYVGKWHMGEDEDSPKPGFDRWVSFRGQGVYVDPVLNVDGRRVQRQGYTTDILTDYALEWLRQQRGSRDGRPFFLVLSSKAVHAEFIPAPRHRGRYAAAPIPYPATMANTASNYRGKPDWVRAQRGSWHGVDYMYHGQMEFDEFYRRYAETLLALDESVGRVLDYLDRSGLARGTLVLYMGDNGFLLGEHGLIDKRHAYEESIRIPMLVYAPGWIRPGTAVTELVRNIDVAPTILELAGLRSPEPMDGRSVVAALTGGDLPEDGGELLYEYYWEYAFPHTPTTLALRGDRFKYVFYHGVWDRNELYDLTTDPEERINLIDVPAYRDTVRAMHDRLWTRLRETDGLRIPLRRGDWQAAERKPP